MHDKHPLSTWDTAVAAYLNSRRAIGRAYVTEEWILGRVRKFLVMTGAKDLDATLFDRWRAQFRGRSSSLRVRHDHTIYKFYVYRRRSDPSCFLPDRSSFARQKPHPLPTIIEPKQVVKMLAYAARLPSGTRSPLRRYVMRLAIVLLYTAGLRRGELVRLTLGDVDEHAGVLRIRESKFHKSRVVPLSKSARAELRRYLGVRQRAKFDQHREAPLLCTRGTKAYTGNGLHGGIRHLLDAAGIRDSTGQRPCVHDFRHSFAVHALLRWYETDADVQSSLPKLALYMGHVSIASTAYYLRWMPAVISRASDRFERSCASVIDGGAP